MECLPSLPTNGRRSITIGVVLTSLLLCSCQGDSTRRNVSDAQRLVDQIVAKHPTLVRLTIHAVPTGETESRIIASNISEKLGRASDPEDLRAMTTKQPVVLREGPNLDVTMPILDKVGKAVAAAGITLADDGARSEQVMLSEAEAIAAEVTDGIRATGKLPW